MYKKLLFFLCLSVIVLSSTTIHAKGWRGIVPLHSTRADVEKLLGKPIDDSKLRSSEFEYEIKGYKVVVVYSSGECPKCEDYKYDYDYKVPKDTVISIGVWPKKPISVSKAKIDLKSFGESCDFGSITSYVDAEEGFAIEVEEGKVIIFYYHPPKKELYLLCPSCANPNSCK
jgi:hypothetical protein